MVDPAVVAAIRREVAAHESFARDVLLELVGLASVGPDERAAQERFVRLAVAAGLDAALVRIPLAELTASERYVETGLPYDDRPNAVARLAGGPGAAVVVNSHMDTVHPTGGWTHRALGEATGGRVYGLGSADAKGSLVASLVAARALSRLDARLPGDFLIQSVIDEEGSGNGSLAAVLGMGPDPVRLVVVMEPTDLEVAYGHRGMLAIELACPGRSAHGATGGGINAISGAARAVMALEQLAAQLGDRARPGYLPPSLNIGVIEGGQEVYTTPDACRVEFSVRYAPGQKEELLVAVSNAIDGLAAASQPGFSPRVDRVRDFDAAETSPEEPAVAAFIEAAMAVRPTTGLTTLAGTCDARHFRNMRGIPVVIYGPGRLANAHAPEEHVEIADVLTAAAVLATFSATA